MPLGPGASDVGPDDRDEVLVNDEGTVPGDKASRIAAATSWWIKLLITSVVGGGSLVPGVLDGKPGWDISEEKTSKPGDQLARLAGRMQNVHIPLRMRSKAHAGLPVPMLTLCN